MMLMKTFICWRQARGGATAIEYALLAGGIGAACITAFYFVGDGINGILHHMGDALGNILATPEEP
jgi:Flp pilus assembly pilin Flp